MYTIFIDSGHGGEDPGAVGELNGLTVNEKDVNLSVSNKLALLLLNKNYKVLYRDKDGYVRLSTRCELAKQGKADFFISIHCNSSKNKQAQGIETWYYVNSAKGKAFADCVQRSLIKNTSAKDRGIKASNDLYVLEHTKAVAILVELGFMSNAEEVAKLTNSDYQDTLAQAIADAITEHIK